jgi:hypothetical protein
MRQRDGVRERLSPRNLYLLRIGVALCESVICNQLGQVIDSHRAVDAVIFLQTLCGHNRQQLSVLIPNRVIELVGQFTPVPW